MLRGAGVYLFFFLLVEDFKKMAYKNCIPEKKHFKNVNEKKITKYKSNSGTLIITIILQ